MAPIPLRQGQWRFGADYRMTKRSMRGIGRVAFSPWSSPEDNPFSVFASDFDGGLHADALPILFVTSSPPFSADDQGKAYQSGTLWAAAWASAPRNLATLPGTTTPETSNLFSFAKPGRNQWLMYRAVRIKSTATGRITIKKPSSGATLAEITVHGSDGANQTIFFDEFAGFNDEVGHIVADWGASVGDIPPYQVVEMHPAGDLEYWAIPATLPIGYTARIAGNFHYQTHGPRALLEPGVPLPGPYLTAEMSQLTVPGIGPSTGFLWIAGAPWVYGWQPEAIDQASFVVTAQATPDIFIPSPPAPSPITIPGVITNGSRSTHGLLSWSMFIQCQDGFGAGVSTGGAGYTVRVTRTDTGADLVNTTYSAADLLAGQTVTGATVENAALGDDVTITVTLTRSGSPHDTGIVFVWFRGQFRCDIPLPYSITGADQVAGGGYLPSKLVAPTYASNNTLERLAAGVTSYTPATSGKPVAFIVGADGWYRVTQDARDLPGVGEDEFNYGQSQQVDRGHAGRSFYAGAISTTAMALASYSPAFGSIAAGGTTFALTTEGVWAFKSIALPKAGVFRISIYATDMDGVIAGLVFEWSTTDATCLDPDGMRRWESMNILVFTIDAIWAGTAITPPVGVGGPGIRDAWIVGTNATGAWTGHDTEVAVWDEVADGWHFYKPRSGAYMEDLAGTDWTWFDGVAWKASTDPVLEILVRVTQATSVACTLRWLTNERGPGTPHYKMKWALA